MDVASHAPADPPPADRPPVARGELRRRIVRGTVINAVALGAVDLLVLAQGLIVTRLLGPAAIGLYGIVTVTTMTVVALKRVGVDEAFVAQDEPEQALEFQRAFTLELAISAVFALILCALAPVVAAVYGDSRLFALMAATAYLPLAFALQAPTWIFFRRMDFARQRMLQGIVPLLTFVVTVPLAAAGAGVWSLVIGPAVGNLAGAIAAIGASPYPLALRWDPATARRYLRFSAWVLLAAAATLVILQGQVLALNLHDGLRAVGFVTLAATFARYVDRADQVVTITIYPAICAIRGRTAALAELFVRSNRATLLWTLPAAAGIVLFAPALVDHVLGRQWGGAVVLVQGLAVAAALQQVGFNWFSFYRARGDSRPGAIEAVAGAVAFVAFAVPGLLAGGFTGFVAGRCAAVLVQLAIRARYVRALLPSVRARDVLARPVVPTALGVAAVVALRAVPGWSGDAEAGALAELALFCAVVAGTSVAFERDLLRELGAALRGRGGLAAPEEQPGEDDRDAGERGHLPVPVQAGVHGPDERGGRGRGDGGV
ncbi:MAG: polysaccharide transporter, family [Solirubrobacteraceae bacterium]|jgi:PST family polysaccharide transporter/lipopolysaccharide exporter|nr:polysaccharide transporter, family [Solirubrobacteraceae bacterium]